jgi:hypothetical protein
MIGQSCGLTSSTRESFTTSGASCSRRSALRTNMTPSPGSRAAATLNRGSPAWSTSATQTKWPTTSRGPSPTIGFSGRRASAAGVTSDRGEALRDYRLALRYGDQKAAQAALARYESLGGTKKQPEARRSSGASAGPIAKKDRAAFLASLTDDQLDTFQRAERYWQVVGDLTRGRARPDPLHCSSPPGKEI